MVALEYSGIPLVISSEAIDLKAIEADWSNHMILQVKRAGLDAQISLKFYLW